MVYLRLFQDSSQDSRSQDRNVVIIGHHPNQFALVHVSMQVLAASLPSNKLLKLELQIF